MRDESEIRKAWDVAVEKGQTNVAYRSVADALAWVLEESDDEPARR